MRKRLGCMLAAILLVLAHMHVALAAAEPDAGRIREDALAGAQLSEGTGTVLGSDLSRADIVSIEVLDSLECAPAEAWDVSAAGDGSVMAWVKDGALTIAANGTVKAPRNARGMFANYTNATEMRFNGCFDTSDTENMYGMFLGCRALQTLALDGFDTSGATNMAFMFSDCGQLKALDVSGFDTSRVEDMDTMFQSCVSLEELDVSGFDTSRVTALDYMFFNCSSLKVLDASGFDTRNVTTMKRMFYNCGALQKVVVGRRFVAGNCVDIEDMFTRSAAMIERDGATMTVGEWLDCDLTKALAASFDWPRLRADIPTSAQLSEGTGTVLGSDISRADITSIEVLNSLEGAPDGSWDVSESGDGSVRAWVADGALNIAGNGGVRAPESAYLLFSNYINATSIRFNGSFDTYETNDMTGMFYGCAALKTLDAGGLDTANTTSMSSMFEGCESLESLDLSGFNTFKVTGMSSMFKKCVALESLDVSSFNTSGVTDLSYMFDRCERLKALDVSGFDTASAQDMNTMFQRCASLEALDVSGFDTSDVTAMDYMFNGCASLKRLDVSGFDTNRVTTFKHMFYGCPALEEIRMSRDFVAVDGADTGDMFTKTVATIVRDGTHMTPAAWLNGDVATGAEETPEEPAMQVYAGAAPQTGTVASAAPATDDEPESYDAPVSLPGGHRMRNDALGDGQLGEVSGTVLGSDINRDEVTRIEFQSSLEGAPEDAWDASEAGDESVLAWLSEGTLTIAADGGVLAPVDGRGLFANYTKVRRIRFNGSFDTSEMTSMYAMFSMDSSLEALDVSWMNTSNVTNMYAMFNACQALTSLNISGFDTRNVENMGGMFYNCAALEALDVSGFDTSNVTDMNGMFRSCGKLKALDVSGFDTANVKDMTNMFYNCEQLETLDLSGFGTSRVASMDNMFCQCAALKRIVFTGLDLSNVKSMEYAFSECESLVELDVGADSPAGRADIQVNGIFEQSPQVTVYSNGARLSLEQWLGTETVEPQAAQDGAADAAPDGQAAFHEEGEQQVNAGQAPEPSFEPAPGGESGQPPVQDDDRTPESASDDAPVAGDLGSVPRMRGDVLTREEAEGHRGTVLGSGISRSEVRHIAFVDSLEDAPPEAWDVSEAGDGSVRAWISSGELTVAGRGGVNAPLNASGLFADYTSLEGISFNGCFRTAETTDMSFMFYRDGELMELDCSGFDTSRVQSMQAMFSGCSGLEALEVAEFITDNVTDMSGMFSDCNRLKALDVSRWRTGSVTDMRSMFDNCNRLKALDVAGFDTKQVTDMGFMFRGCEEIGALDLNGFDTANVADMQSMFAECRSLTQLDASRFSTGSVRNFSKMFMNCTRLDKLTVSDAFVALGETGPEDEDMLTKGPVHIQNGDDVIDAEQWQRIIRITAGLKKGDKGSSVEWIQRVLTKLGYLNGEIDGVFGKKTQSALMEFQSKCGLESTGVADDGTLNALARRVSD